MQVVIQTHSKHYINHYKITNNLNKTLDGCTLDTNTQHDNGTTTRCTLDTNTQHDNGTTTGCTLDTNTQHDNGTTTACTLKYPYITNQINITAQRPTIPLSYEAYTNTK